MVDSVSTRGVYAGDIPMPSERPYTLGNTPEDSAAATSTEVSSSRVTRIAGRRPNVARNDVAESIDTPASARPVSTAYAAVARDGSISLLSGRGLY